MAPGKARNLNLFQFWLLCGRRDQSLWFDGDAIINRHNQWELENEELWTHSLR